MKRLGNFGVDRIVRLRKFALGLAVFAALLLLPPSQSTHAWPGDLFLAWSSPELDNSRSVAWGDWDGDGDLDLAVGNLSEPNRVYRNEGGNLSLAWSSTETDSTFAVAWGDWDNDGDPDLAVGNGYGDPNRVYRNEGASLTLAWTSAEADDTQSVAWGDWDNDDDLDLAAGNDGDPNRVYRNDGGSLVLAWSSSEADLTQSVSWGDWDGDHDLDLAAGNSFLDPNRVYVTEGGNLTLAWSSPELDDTYSVAWGDWDYDGDPDLAVGNDGDPNRVYHNEGGSLVLAWSSPETDYTQSVAWGDWDDDGDLDLVAGNDDEVNRVYRNEGGSLTLAWSSLEADRTNSVAWGDWDGDDDLDLAVANRDQPDRVYRNEGGSLGLAWSSSEIDDTHSVAWGDWDGDGDLDLAVGNDWQPNRVYRNEGGELSPVWFSPEADRTLGVAWGDWDGDGDLDLAVGNYNEPNRVYRNDGGSLSLAWSSEEADDTYSVAWGDWDNDGDLDLAVGNEYYSPSRVYRNGGGSLTLAWSADEVEPFQLETRSVAWGDWDGDGDLDLALGNYFQSNLVYENDGGDLGWEPVWSSPEADDTRSVAWGDWDGDGDVDLAAGNYSDPNRVYENAGGSLALAWSSAEEDKTLSVAWGDWDGDGDLDLAAGNYSGQPNRVYRNEGGDLALAWSSPETDYTVGVAWGDWDRDGDLDLAVGNEDDSNRVYRNKGGALTAAWSSLEAGRSMDVAWGDWDGDGDLDLAVGEYSQPNRVYRNDAGRLIPVWASSETDYTRSVAWGDWDGDGDLDLAVGNYWSHPDRVYRNDGNDLVLAWSSSGPGNTFSVAWGDWDGDGDLDLAVGKDGDPNRVYRNDGGSLALAWSSLETDYTRSVAWGDWDGDGDLDLAAGNYDEPSRVYRNDGGNLALAWSSAQTDESCSVAWADWDGDGDLDLAVGNDWDQPDRVYRNDGNDLVLAWSSPAMDGTHSLAWGDWDGDGDLDLATGGDGDPNRVYRNEGGSLVLTWSSLEKEDTESVAWGDWDGDGDLDLIAGNTDQPNRVYRNHSMEGPTLPDATTKVHLSYPGPAAVSLYGSATVLGGPTVPISYTLLDAEGDPARFVKAYYSLDGGGQWRPAVATGDTLTNDLATDHRARTLAPVPIPDGDALASQLTFGGTGRVGDLELTLSISHPQNSQLVAALQAPWPAPTGTSVLLFEGVGGDGDGFDSLVLTDRAARPIAVLEGVTTTVNGAYRPVEPLSRFRGAPLNTPFTLVITDSVAGETGTLEEWRLRSLGAEHLFTWDIWASGVFGSSDNTVFRLDVYQGFAGPGPYQHPFYSAQTLPFRVRGNQVRVLSGTEPIANALVYRQPAGQGDTYLPYSDLWGQPFRTDPIGYLQGRGEIDGGDRLVALAPVTATESYTLYHTNATPTDTGLEAYTVTQMGVQTLTVSADNPLLLFDLDVSLEWDARNDDQFLSQLVFDLQRASEFLYDWSNGQAALGEIMVYHDREQWNDAHVRVYASNRLRPNAAQGGIVSDLITETVDAGEVITYTAGQVRMGAVWNRYGEAGGNPGEDWPRSLAHELGHYALYLDDNYLGFDDAGRLIPVEGCPGAMSDPYRDDYSEFHPDQGWLPACQQTLSHQLTGRSDWGTITTFYPVLDGVTSNPGPSGLPLAVTQVTFVEPVTSTSTLETPVLYLYQEGHHVQPGSGARVFLYQGEWATDLGRPVVDQVLARGAEVGDRVCLYELAAGRLGCETISAGDEQLELVPWPDWQPELIVTPVTSRTIVVSVTHVPAGLPLWARPYPVTDPAPPGQLLTESGSGYATVFTLEEPAPEGYIQVWVAEGGPRREVVTDYTIGGNPILMRGRGILMRGRGILMRGRGAPAVSADGQVILFGDGLEFGAEQFVVLQAASVMPSPPPWATVVGQAYRVSVSPEPPDLSGASISFSYMGNEVPAGEEGWLRVYRWKDVTQMWELLPTTVDPYYNMATSQLQGEGLYVLMSSLEVPLVAPGWNLFAYPVAGTRPVTQALQSIEGYYATVYGYDGLDPIDPWKMYDVTVPDWVNDLEQLQFGRGYWISVTQPITLYLKGGSGEEVAREADLLSMGSPPATYYGVVEGGGSFVPAAGMPLAAQVEGHLCGQSETQQVGDQVGYSVNVLADGPGGATGCGELGRTVAFRVGARPMISTAVWDDRRVWELALQPADMHAVYLPLVVKSG